MLGIILGCYREFEGRLTLAERCGPRSTAYDVVREYATNHIGTFTKQNALASCPSLGSSSVEAALKKLVQDGTLIRLGSG